MEGSLWWKNIIDIKFEDVNPNGDNVLISNMYTLYFVSINISYVDINLSNQTQLIKIQKLHISSYILQVSKNKMLLLLEYL